MAKKNLSKKSKTALRNKRRGKGFQSTLAKLTGGRNIGTLGGEDVEHDEFSYEAKTLKGGFIGDRWLAALESKMENCKTCAVIWSNGLGHPALAMLRFDNWVNRNDCTYFCAKKITKRFKGAKMFDQCVKNCPAGKTPVVVVHSVGQYHKNDIVVIQYDDLAKLVCLRVSKKVKI